MCTNIDFCGLTFLPFFFLFLLLCLGAEFCNALGACACACACVCACVCVWGQGHTRASQVMERERARVPSPGWRSAAQSKRTKEPSGQFKEPCLPTREK